VIKAARSRLWLILALTLLLPACSLPGQTQPPPVKRIHISGIVYALDIGAVSAGRLAQPVGVTVRIRCNEGSVIARENGAYSLAIRQAEHYRCAASYSGFADGMATITAVMPQQDIILDFGPTGTTSCDTATTIAPITCAPLTPPPGSLKGTVTGADTHSPLANATVECWSNVDQTRLENLTLATTDAKGHYVMSRVAMGPDDCVVLGKDDIYTKHIESGKLSTLDIQICQSHCPTFRNHGGSVMESFSAYVIFWLPKGYGYEPYGSTMRFETLITQYFRDIGGTALYGLLTQYWGTQGQIHNHATLGGVFRDSQPYPAAGTRAHPLGARDIESEIGRVMRVAGWSESSTHEFFLFTGYGVQECDYPEYRDGGCTFRSGRNDYCAYHSYFGGTIFAYIPVIPGCVGLPARSPNGDVVADSTISIVSHEQFESVTDPMINGWYGEIAQKDEVGDLCFQDYGPIRFDGSNVTLNNGHRYIVQEEWSQRAGRCALS
jgi:phosphate-induced protein 1